MSRPIRPTPPLEGEFAKEFIEQVLHPKFSAKKKAFLEECKKIFEETKRVE